MAPLDGPVFFSRLFCVCSSDATARRPKVAPGKALFALYLGSATTSKHLALRTSGPKVKFLLALCFDAVLMDPLLQPAINHPAASEALLALNPSASSHKTMTGVDSKSQVEASFINRASGTVLCKQLLKVMLAATPWDALPTLLAPKFAALQNPSMSRVAFC